MNNADIRAALATLSEVSGTLENIYIENEGEVTDESEQLEGQKAAIAALLTEEGIDSLGRWLKAKQDEEVALKAEKAYVDRRIKAAHRTIDYIKGMAGEILRATGRDEVKGSLGYKFKSTTITSTTYDKEALAKEYLEMATEAARNAGLPDCIDVDLVTNASQLAAWRDGHEGQMGEFVLVSSSPACTFTKPKAAKEA